MARIATVSYLNSRPLVAHLDRSVHEVVEGHPSEIATLLQNGEVDLALVPVAAVLSDPTLRINGGYCIGAEGPVDSVFLVAETPPEQWTSVALDGVSRTSVVLTHLLLDGPLADVVSPDLIREPVPLTEGLDRARGTTAALVIGDAARKLPDRLTTRLDLAELWTQWTELPFVFAVWAGRETVERSALADLRAAAQQGLSERDEQYASTDLCYLTERIRYPLDERALVGLRRFAALAYQAGLVAHETIQFFGPGERERIRPAANSVMVPNPLPNVETMVAQTKTWTHLQLVNAAHALRLEHSPVSSEMEIDWTWPVQVHSETTALEVTEQISSWLSQGGKRVVLWIDKDHTWSVSDWATYLGIWSHKGADVWAFSLAQLRGLAEASNSTIESVAAKLREAGLKGLAEGAVCSIQDGGVEGARQFAVQSRLGLGDGLVVEYGFGEDLESRIRLLYSLKALHGVQWLRVVPAAPDVQGAEPLSATAMDHVQMTALCRILLPEIPDHRAVWLSTARVIAQQSLLAGCNRIGSILLPVDSDATEWNRQRVALERDLKDIGIQLMNARDPQWAKRSRRGRTARPRPA